MKCNARSLSGKSRNSSIELLKIIGIVLIIISHVIKTLQGTDNLTGVQDYVLNLSTATTNVQHLILAMLRSSGAFGNTIFFICSAWFLLDSDKVSKKKMLQMLLDIWAVSIVILIIVFFLRDGDISLTMIIKQIFPTAFENNWYMTCYLLFYPIHPFLNWIINKMSKTTLFRATFALSFLYIGINYLRKGRFFTSELILWVTIYFVIAYMKKYLVNISDNIKVNLAFIGIGFLGNYGLVLLTDFVGLKFGIFSDGILRWASNCSPFIILMVIGMLNIARNIHFENNVINYISSLSLLVYIIHENLLLRSYYRPLMWQWVYTNYGYRYILLWTFVLVLLVFLFGLIASIIYNKTIKKGVNKIVDVIYPLLRKEYIKIERLLLKLN